MSKETYLVRCVAAMALEGLAAERKVEERIRGYKHVESNRIHEQAHEVLAGKVVTDDIDVISRLAWAQQFCRISHQDWEAAIKVEDTRLPPIYSGFPRDRA